MELVFQDHSAQSVETWAFDHFGNAPLGDVRRQARLLMIGQAMAQQSGKTIPELFDRPYDVKATYTFFHRPEATPDNIQQTHREHVRQEMMRPGTYLLLEDTSEFIFPFRENIKGMGSVGTGAKHLQGFHLHSTMAVRWPERFALTGEEEQCGAKRPPVEILGLADQQYHRRKRRRKTKTRRNSKKGELESELWEQAIQRMGRAPTDDCGVRWIRVCDRGADIYEHIRDCKDYGYGFVIRASKDRNLEDPDTGDANGKLFETVWSAEALGEFQLFLQARPGQPARTATLSVSAVKIRLRAPQRPGHGPGSLPPIECWAIRVSEKNAPKGVKPLEWILLTDQPAETFHQIVEVALVYSARWIIEEFHKGIKTGCGAEKLQMETAHRIFAAISVMSLVALRLIHFREQFRINPEGPAEESGLDELEIQILEVRLKRDIKTVKDVALAVGRLGGHMNRKADGMPGWLTLWRGMKKLQLLKEGVDLQFDLRRFGQ